MKKIELPCGEFALVDDQDYDYLIQYNWYKGGKRYVVGYNPCDPARKKLLMHREILKAPKGMLVDHANHNPLDNRRENIRLCTAAQNSANTRKRSDGCTSKYRGVSRVLTKKGVKYKAKIVRKSKTIYLGRFTYEDAAAMAYNCAARYFDGEFACLNDVP